MSMDTAFVIASGVSWVLGITELVLAFACRRVLAPHRKQFRLPLAMWTVLGVAMLIYGLLAVPDDVVLFARVLAWFIGGIWVPQFLGLTALAEVRELPERRKA